MAIDRRVARPGGHGSWRDRIGLAVIAGLVVLSWALYVSAPYTDPKASGPAVSGAPAAQQAGPPPAAAPARRRTPRTAPNALEYLFYLSGLAAFVLMTACVVLASRPKSLEPWFGGLDRMYHVHKWSGITAFAVIWVHYLLEDRKDGPVNPNRVSHAVFEADGTVNVSRLAAVIGEYAFYAVVVLVVLSLLKAVPYRFWRMTHKLMGLLFAALVLHVLLIKQSFPTIGAMNAFLLVLCLAGVAAALYKTLSRDWLRPGSPYRVRSVTAVPRGVEIALEPLADAMSFDAGQFVFLKLHAKGLGEPHPFTISSPPGERVLRLSVRAAGDHTAKLLGLQAGTTATVQGPYGRFSYSSGGERQVWVAGGIGITPFLSWIGQLPGDASAPGRRIVMFHCIARTSEAMYGQELSRCAAACRNFSFHVVSADRDGLLDMAMVEKVTGWAPASMDLFVCGPEALRSKLQREARGRGLHRGNFHFERFAFR